TTTLFYTLSLHDALPICLRNFRMNWSVCPRIVWSNTLAVRGSAGLARIELSESNLKPAASTSRRTVEDSMRCKVSVTFAGFKFRSEEHTSELQSLAYLVC